MAGITLLTAVTVLYAGYNLFLKLSGGHVPSGATTTILATMCIQVAALSTSIVFLAVLAARGGQVFSLSQGSYVWAAVAGFCIGGAEIGYLYLFGGVGGMKSMDASIAIPTIVSGTIVIALLFSFLFLKEQVSWTQVLGSCLILTGIFFLFMQGPGSA